MDYLVKIGKKEYTVTIDSAAHPLKVMIDGQPVETFYSTSANNSRLQLLMDNRSYDIVVAKQNGNFSVFIYGREFTVSAEDERLAKIREVAGMDSGGDSRKELIAPMPGLVTKLLKQPGDMVAKGESIIIVEAMKMENEIKALNDGTIKEIKVSEGQSIDKNAVMVIFE